MKFKAHWGSDTGFYIVDVYLESERESNFSHDEIWAALSPLLAVKKIHRIDVIDFFLYRRDGTGEWVHAGILFFKGK